MLDQTIARKYRIVNVTSTTTAQILGDLVRTAIAAKSAPANVLPSNDILQIAITSSANLEVRDTFTGDALTLASSTRLVLPSANVMDQITVKNAATVNVELFFG